ncbi:MAG TPA: rod shape-determining protein RodA [Candidatus Dormibacteraeota bacterium]|jgi:rod shape determining protein RodA|nr:rod shape-determining protein RodA [Candidatus Dormibacteraeota bacterium]
MLRMDRRLLQNVDWLLLGAALFIIGLSLVCLWSLNPGRGISALMWRQLSWVGVGLVGLLVVVSVDYRNLVRFAPVFYVVGLGLLLSVFILGRTVSGARRWIHVGPLTVQPSELFKLIFIITLAWALTSARGERLSRVALVGTFVLLGVPFFLVVKQPDLGTALVLVPVLGATLVGLGLRMKVLGGLALGSVALMPLAWFVLKPYQRDRLLVYLDPFRDPLGTAYNVIQAKIAIGSGQLLGKGIGGATQSRLAFLPERHTDFIFAVFAEMWGFLGCLVLIVAYALLVLRGFEIAAGTRETRGRILALGVTSVFAVQILINIGMVTGLLPIVGIPLPLMSYGGSSMVVSLTALGLLISIRMRQFH